MRPTELVPGNCYFSVGFSDTNMLLPTIQTLVFVDARNDATGNRHWLFEEPSTIREAGRASEAEHMLCFFSEEQLYQVIDFPGLIAALAEVAIDHPIRRPEAVVAGASNLDLEDLAPQIERFLSDPGAESLIVTIRFTDDGLSLTRHKGDGLALMFFLQTRLPPAQEPGVRGICAEAGLAPEEDYTCNGGRTRILAYPVRGELDALPRLCARLLLQAFGMRSGDTLIYRVRPVHGNGAV